MIKFPAIAAMAVIAAGSALADGIDVTAGKALFERNWVAAPASTDAADGLGPLFNATSCNSCHRDGGAAQIFLLDGKVIARGLVIRLAASDGGPHPGFGSQLQDRAIAGLKPEGVIAAALVGPALTVATRLFEATAGGHLEEVRIAPSLRGRRLLERIDEGAVIALADPGDADRDGISGRARMVIGPDGTQMLGRFGYKAGATSVDMQTASAAAIDLGLSSRLRPFPFGDCTAAQTDCLARATGQSASFDGEEISGDVISLMAGYVRSLESKNASSNSRELKVFAMIGCAACHRPAMPDAAGNPLPAFTDLLLHDLGGETAGTIPEAEFSVAEWRTAPLIDLAAMNGMRRYLHDGKAADVNAAILLHSGEASAARAAYRKLGDGARRSLIAYLEGL